MAFKLPAPSILKGKEKTAPPKTAASAEGAAAQPISSGFFLGYLAARKKQRHQIPSVGSSKPGRNLRPAFRWVTKHKKSPR